jgi:hypothetical protein
MLRTIRILVVVFVLGALTQPRSLAAEFRTWSDASGQFSVKAKFVSADGAKVTLQQEDGSTLEIELAKLSDADRKYVAEQKKAGDNPFKKKSDSPFQKKGEGPAGDAPLTTVDWAGVKIIDINPASATWKLTPPAGPGGDLKPEIVRLPPKSDFFEKANRLAINVTAKRAVVGYSTNRPGANNKAGTRLVTVDLEAGKVIGTATSPGQFAPVALADDGTRVVVRRDEFGGDKQDRLEIWSLDGSEVR